jgi:hypothetical protein
MLDLAGGPPVGVALGFSTNSRRLHNQAPLNLCRRRSLPPAPLPPSLFNPVPKMKELMTPNTSLLPMPIGSVLSRSPRVLLAAGLGFLVFGLLAVSDAERFGAVQRPLLRTELCELRAGRRLHAEPRGGVIGDDAVSDAGRKFHGKREPLRDLRPGRKRLGVNHREHGGLGEREEPQRRGTRALGALASRRHSGEVGLNRGGAEVAEGPRVAGEMEC